MKTGVALRTVAALLLAASFATAGWAVGAVSPATARSPAATAGEHPKWQELSPAQRSALAPLEHEWPQIDGERKQQWIEIASRFSRMSPGERQRAQAHMTDWAKLSPKERGEARLNYQEIRQLSPEERQARWQQYQSLTPEQRKQLAARAAPASGPTAQARANHRTPSVDAPPTPKSNIVGMTPAPGAKPKVVSPAVVEAKSGATTRLISRHPLPPAHEQPGLPKVATTPGFVDRTTLLPRRGAQGAGVRAPSAPAVSAFAPVAPATSAPAARAGSSAP
jgi:hypothetical protein